MLGAGLAALLNGAMRLLLFGVDLYEPMTLVAVASVLALAGGLSCLVPALRAASVDPMQALRSR